MAAFVDYIKLCFSVRFSYRHKWDKKILPTSMQGRQPLVTSGKFDGVHGRSSVNSALASGTNGFSLAENGPHQTHGHTWSQLPPQYILDREQVA